MEICQRLTPTALPPVEVTQTTKDFRIIWHGVGSDLELLERSIVISFRHPEPLAQGDVRFWQIRGYTQCLHGQSLRLVFSFLSSVLPVHAAVPQ